MMAGHTEAAMFIDRNIPRRFGRDGSSLQARKLAHIGSEVGEALDLTFDQDF